VGDRKRDPGTPLIEWIVGGLGALIFLGMVLALIASGLAGEESPPSIRIHVERVTPALGGYVMEFSARNESDATAADVSVIAELDSGGEMQTREARFDYLPPRSERRGGFFFDSDPRAGALELRAEGYNKP